MHVEAINPTVNVASFLNGAQFADAFSMTTDDTTLTARQAAERMFAKQPRWVSILMNLRDQIVRVVGLKTADHARQSASNLVGFFPVISETPERLVAGLNDRHLDFRVVVDVARSGSQQQVTATTIVLTHNWLGRIYLTIIMPFHRLIVRALLKRVASQSLTSAR